MSGFFNPHSFEKGSAGTPKRITQCGKCGLVSKCISPKMSPSGQGKHKVLFIGDVPGKTEDEQGAPFLGDSGKLLRQIMEGLGFELDACWSTNAITCRPPNGKIEPYMTSCCRPSLLKTIRTLQPNVIVPLGKVALDSLLYDLWKKDVGTLDRWVGWTIPVPEYGAWVCPTYHPSFLLRREKDVMLHTTFQHHIMEAMQHRKKGPVSVLLPDLESQVEIILRPSDAKARLKDLFHQDGYLAWDYETTGLKPDRKAQRIVSVSFCLNGQDTFAFPMTPLLEEPLRRVLQKKSLKKIASNLKFEERWTRAKLGIGVAGWHWDTMLAAHCLDNRSSINSIKFQAFIHFGISDYSSHISPYLKASSSNGLNRIEELDLEDVLRYNGLDSLIEYMVMEKQKEIFHGLHA